MALSPHSGSDRYCSSFSSFFFFFFNVREDSLATPNSYALEVCSRFTGDIFEMLNHFWYTGKVNGHVSLVVDFGKTLLRKPRIRELQNRINISRMVSRALLDLPFSGSWERVL